MKGDNTYLLHFMYSRIIYKLNTFGINWLLSTDQKKTWNIKIKLLVSITSTHLSETIIVNAIETLLNA